MVVVLTRVRAFMDEHNLVQPGDTLVVAVSGGPDSICLLHVLRELRPIYDLRLHVAHLNHQLRGPASNEDADFVARLAADWGLPVTISAYDVPAYQKAHGLSLEAAAREVRYAFLAGVAAQTGAAGVALGHTASDQVETVVIHWLRGAGPAGLRGMSPVQTLRIRPMQPPTVGQDGILPYVRLVRPLLPITRAEVENYCAAHALPYRDDLSNLDEAILRNRVRRHLLPVLRDYNPNLDATLRRAADAFAEVSRFLQAQVDAAWPAVVREERLGAVTFDRTKWQRTDPAVQRGLVREAVARLLWGAPLDLGWDHAEAVLNLAARGAVGAEAHLPHDLVAVLDHDALVLGRPEALAVPPDGLHLTVDWLPLAVPGVTALPGTDWLLEVVLSEAPAGPPETLDPPPSAHCVYLDADRAGPELALRRRRPGDRFRPLGLGGTRKLKDFLIDAHVPQRWRDGVPLLVALDRILWVVGYRLAEDAAITPATRRALRLRILAKVAEPSPG